MPKLSHGFQTRTEQTKSWSLSVHPDCKYSPETYQPSREERPDGSWSPRGLQELLLLVLETHLHFYALGNSQIFSPHIFPILVIKFQLICCLWNPSVLDNMKWMHEFPHSESWSQNLDLFPVSLRDERLLNCSTQNRSKSNSLSSLWRKNSH